MNVNLSGSGSPDDPDEGMPEPVAAYLRTLRTYAVIDRARELQWRNERRLDQEYQPVAKSYLHLTALLALRLAPPSLDPIDAIQEANKEMLALLSDPSVDEPAVVLAERIWRRFHGTESEG